MRRAGIRTSLNVIFYLFINHTLLFTDLKAVRGGS